MAIDTGAVDRALGAIGTTFRLTRLYPPSHPAVLEAMRHIATSLPALAGLGSVEWKIGATGLHWHGQHLLPRNTQVAELAGLLFARGIRAIQVNPGVTPEHWLGLFGVAVGNVAPDDAVLGRITVHLGRRASQRLSASRASEEAAPATEPIAAPAHIHANAEIPTPGPAEKTKVSNGAYTLVSRISGSFIELARNPHYWNASNVLIERVRYINAESEATEMREYVAGQIDMTSTIPAPDLERITKDYGAEIQMAPILGTLYLALDVSEPPLRDNRDLRQALSMAVDRDLISEHVTLGVSPAYTFVAKGITGYNPPAYEWSQWPRDRQLAYARALFNHSGYSEKKPLHLTLYYNSGESIQRIMIAIAASWKNNLGVVANLVSDEFRVFLTGRKDHKRWDVARLGWSADYNDPSSFLEVFSKTNIQNDPTYKSSEFNDLIDAARIEPNPDRRILLLRRSEEVLLNDYPIIPVYFYTARRLVKPYLGGAEITPLNHTHSKHLYWKDASKGT